MASEEEHDRRSLAKAILLVEFPQDRQVLTSGEPIGEEHNARIKELVALSEAELHEAWSRAVERIQEQDRQTFTGETPEWEWWAREPYWTIDQAAALLLGLDPDVARHDLISQRPEESLLRQQFLRLHGLVHRSFELSGARSRKNPPLHIIDWADKVELPDVPKELVEAVYNRTRRKWRGELETEIWQLREQLAFAQAERPTTGGPRDDSYDKFFYWCFVKKHGYSPDAYDNATSKLVKAVEDAGGKLDKDTARKILNRAYERFQD